MSNIDKQAVQAVADLKAGYTLGHADVAILNELARIALASLEAEAVAYIRDGFRADGVHFCGGIITAEEHERTKPALSDRYTWKHQPLYTAPPAPVSDSLLSELLGIAKRAADEADECAHAEFSDDSMEYSAAIADWERRATRLQGADGNSPAIPDGFEDRNNKIAYDILGFGRLVVSGNSSGDLDLEIREFSFDRGSAPTPLKNLKPKYAVQAIVNRLQSYCDAMSCDDLEDIRDIPSQQQREGE